MTAGELCKQLSTLQPEQTIAVIIDRSVSGIDCSGDRVIIDISAVFDIDTVSDDGQIFYRGAGFLPAIFLEAGEEL